MPRAGTTQTRTFVYDNSGRLTSATNPENGTVYYYYNSNNTAQYKHDAKGQETVYSYAGPNQISMVQQFPNGQANAEDTCQRVIYTWGASAPAINRPTTKTYWSCAPNGDYFVEQYSYSPGELWRPKRWR